MRWLTLTGLATLTVAALAALSGLQATAAHADDGSDSRRPAPSERRSGGNEQRADRQQQALAQALAACRARGFADGSSEQRRCAQQLLSGSAAPAPAPASVPTRTTTAPSPAVRGRVVTDRGIVQAAAADTLVLRALDGSSLTVALDARTRIYVDNRGAEISDLQPGSVATVRHVDGGPALDVRIALPPKPKLRTDRGVTDSVTSGGIVIRLGNGTTKSIAVASSTRVQAPNGRAVSLTALAGGLLVDVLYDPSGTVPAQTVKIIRRVA